MLEKKTLLMADFKMNGVMKIKIFLFLLIFFSYLFFASGSPYAEATWQLNVARNFVQYRSLSILQEASLNLVEGGGRIRGIDGRLYDMHSISNVLIMLPIACLESLFSQYLRHCDVKQILMFLGALTGTVVTALTCLVFFSMLLLLGRPLKTCFHTTLSLAFLTIIFPYSAINYEGNLDMFFILSALYFLFNYLKTGKLYALIPSGIFTSLVVCSRDLSMLFFVCMLAFVLYVAATRKKLKILIIFAISILPGLVLWGYYNWLRTGYFYLSATAFVLLKKPPSVGNLDFLAPTANIITGLKNLLLSKGMSIFIFSPVFILSLFGWKKFYRDKKEECLYTLSVILLFLLANAKIVQWQGYWGWGPRYTLPITPLMLIPLSYWRSERDMRINIKKYLFLMVGTFSLFIQLGAVLTNWHGRLGYLLGRKGFDAFLFTAKYSQWWDGIKSLFINLWNLFFGSLLYLENQGYCQGLSAASLYTSRTLFTWWNRIMFMGVSPIFIIAYVVINFFLISYLFIQTDSLIKQNNNTGI